MQLRLSQATIRAYRPCDAPSVARYLNNPKVSHNMTVIPYPYTQAHAEEWIVICQAAVPETHFAIALEDEVIGGIGVVLEASRQARATHAGLVGYWLGEPFWGRGIMTEAVCALTEWALAELRLVRLHASVYARNPASARVLTKAGYQYEGRLLAHYLHDGELIDGLVYAHVRQPGETAPVVSRPMD